MAVANGTYLRFKVRQQQYLQEVLNVVDYKLFEGDDIPIEEICSDLRSHWKTWILSSQVDDLKVVDWELSAYHHVTDEGAGTEEDPLRIKIHFGESHIINGGADAGLLGDNPLPTFVAVSGSKTGSGLTTELTEAAGQTPNLVKDTPMRGGIRFGGISEDHTKDAQGNELATVVGSNWLGSWQAAATELVAPQFRYGATVLYRLQMQIRSDYGPGGVARVSGGSARIRFRPVSGIVINPYVGSQTTRKQRKRFQ